MARYVFALLLLLIAPSAYADIYRWVDERGTVNFTEDPGKVPPKHRKKMTVITEPGQSAPEVTEDVGKEKKSAEQREVEKAPAPKQEKKKAVYGGKDEDAWKAEFAKARGEITAYEGEIAERKARLAKPEKMGRAEYLSIQTEVKRLEEKLASLREKLVGLTESARRAGVPPEL